MGARAEGKVNASELTAGTRIIVVQAYGQNWTNANGAVDEVHTGVGPSRTKTGENVTVARVLNKSTHLVHTGSRQRRVYVIETSVGTFQASPSQTMWLAPEDAAGIKRAYVEALAEDADRQAMVEEDDAAAECPQCDGPFASDGVCADDECGVDKDDANTTERADTPSGAANQMAEKIVTALASPEVHTGSTVIRLLERVWERIRTDQPELPQVVIVTGSGEGAKWGHFRADSWKVREEGAATRQHELFLASEALAKGAQQVLQTMLHEAAHTLAKVRDQKDTSRQGRWHNQIFRKTAEEMGLQHQGAQADKSHGFAFVTLTQATKDRYADLLKELDAEIRLTGHLPSWLGGGSDEDDRGGERIAGKPKGEDDGDKAKSGPVKCVCRCEEPNIIRMSKKVQEMKVVRCDDCQELFQLAE